MHRAASKLPSIGLLLIIAGCGGAPTQPMFVRDPGACSGNGIILLAWTLDGHPPVDAACAGVDHLVLTVQPDSCAGGRISPIPCTAGDHWRYEELPEGPATLTLETVETSGRSSATASMRVVIGRQVPATPTSIALNH
jgi:hypothetical protein